MEYGAKKIVAIPLSYDVNDMPSMKYGHPPKMMLESFNEVIDIARAQDDELRIIDVTNHAHIFGHHRGAYYFEKIIEKAMASDDVWVGTRAADRRSRAGAERLVTFACVPGAAQHEVMRRRPGTVPMAVSVTVPDQP